MAKIRQGFVSNSSSCSFVVAGVMVDEDKLNIHQLVKNLYPEVYQQCSDESNDLEDLEDCLYDYISMNESNIYFGDNVEQGADEGKLLIGYTIAEIHDEYELDNTKMTLNEINNKCKGLLNKLGLDDEEVKIITATRMC